VKAALLVHRYGAGEAQLLRFSTSNRSTPSGRRGDFARQTMLVGLLACAALAAGCQLMSETEYTRPSFLEQQQAILDVVPFGTPHERTLETLKQAGVRGATGVSESIYYCDVWDRGDGSHWYLNVALFFDQSGRLYKVGPGQSDTGAATSVVNSANADTSRQRESAEVRAANPVSAADPERTPAADNASSAERLPAGRAGRRTPFTDADSLR